MTFQWALLVQRFDTGYLWIANVYEHDHLDLCDKAAMAYMKVYPYVEAACFLVYR